jgi:hypothetical protein
LGIDASRFCRNSLWDVDARETKKNCASAWANQTAGRSAQNGGSCTATLDTSAGGELSAGSMLTSGSPMWDVDARETTTLTRLD